MPEEKGLGSKLLGLFVEVKDDAPAEEGAAGPPSDSEKSPADIVAELAAGAAPTRSAPVRSEPLRPMQPPSAGATGTVAPAQVDFDAVFRSAGLDSNDLDRVRKAEELLRSLPESTPLQIKRQIVEASLKAFGFDIAKIVGAAQQQLKALDTWLRLNEQQTAKGISDAQVNIAQLEDKVISLRADINKRTEQLGAMSAAADQRRGQVHQVLEFFNIPART